MDDLHRILLTYIRGVRYIAHDDLLQKYRYIQKRLRDAERVAETNDSETPDLANEIEPESESEAETALANAIAVINNEITKFGFRLDRKHDQNADLTLYYIYVNIDGDEIMKKDAKYTVNELQAIKLVIDLIVESPSLRFSCPRQEAIRAISADTKRLLDLSEYFLSQLVEEGWFIIDSARVKLSIRSLSELKGYLVDRYATRNDSQNGTLISCPVCNELVTEGYFCSECQLGYHRKCDSINRQGSDIATGSCNLGHGELSLVG